MRFPIVLYIVYVVQSLPVFLVPLFWGRRPPATWLLVAAWCSLLMLSASAEWAVASSGYTNLWVSWFFTPAEVAVTIGLLSCWQRASWRRAYRSVAVVIPPLIAVILLAGDANYLFEVWVYPMVSILTFVAVLHTLLGVALGASGPLIREDRFWVCLGLAFFWSGFIQVAPFAYALVESRPEWVLLAYIIRAWIKLAGLFMVIYGLYLAWKTTRSAGLS